MIRFKLSTIFCPSTFLEFDISSFDTSHVISLMGQVTFSESKLDLEGVAITVTFSASELPLSSTVTYVLLLMS